MGEDRFREDAIALYGFLETAERDWFRILTTVQGVGARVALCTHFANGGRGATELAEAVAEAQFAEARNRWSKTTVVAPSDGIVLTRNAEVGQIAVPGASTILLP